VVYTNQAINRYIVETLEPQGVDSFFAWNFFDSMLGEKEYFSDYVFEDKAADLLKKDPALKQKLDGSQSKRPTNWQQCIRRSCFLYHKTRLGSKKHIMRYPVGRF
jgi:hypothetical protein